MSSLGDLLQGKVGDEYPGPTDEIKAKQEINRNDDNDVDRQQSGHDDRGRNRPDQPSPQSDNDNSRQQAGSQKLFPDRIEKRKIKEEDNRSNASSTDDYVQELLDPNDRPRNVWHVVEGPKDSPAGDNNGNHLTGDDIATGEKRSRDDHDDEDDIDRDYYKSRDESSSSLMSRSQRQPRDEAAERDESSVKRPRLEPPAEDNDELPRPDYSPKNNTNEQDNSFPEQQQVDEAQDRQDLGDKEQRRERSRRDRGSSPSRRHEGKDEEDRDREDHDGRTEKRDGRSSSSRHHHRDRDRDRHSSRDGDRDRHRHRDHKDHKERHRDDRDRSHRSSRRRHDYSEHEEEDEAPNGGESRSRRHRGGSRSSSRSRRRDRSGSRSPRTVMVMQLSQRVTSRDLEEFFGDIGEVREVRLIMDSKSQRHKGIAYIEFYESSAASRALSLDGKKFQGAPLQIQPVASERSESRGRGGDRAPHSTSSSSHNHHHHHQYSSSSGHHDHPSSSPMLLPSSRPSGYVGSRSNLPPNSYRIHIGALHLGITDEMLRTIVEPFGHILRLELIKDRNTGSSKGYAFVLFANIADGQEAVRCLDGFELAGKSLRVSVSREKGERERGGGEREREREH